jgi:hypothetical protein
MLRSTVESVRSRCSARPAVFPTGVQHGVGQAQVAFRVFEVDRVDLVRHGRRTDFAGFELLLEVAQRDVAPDVAVQVQQDGVGAREGVEQFGHVVVRFDLDGVRVEHQAQALLDHGLREGRPVERWVGRQVGVVVADGAVHLAEDFHLLDALDGALQAGHHVGHFLAQRGRAGGLAVGARQHRQVGVGVGDFGQLGDHVAQRRQHDLSRAAFSIMPCEVLLMSSEVQAKWMNSDAATSSGTSLTCSLSQYSTALTSWLVTASISLMRAASVR